MTTFDDQKRRSQEQALALWAVKEQARLDAMVAQELEAQEQENESDG